MITWERQSKVRIGQDELKRGLHCWIVIAVVVPHVTDAIQDWVMDVARQSVDSDKQPPEVCIIEVSILCGLSTSDDLH